MKIAVIILFATLFLHNGEGAKILAIFCMPSPSHYFLGNTLLLSLAEKGHDVTMISPFKTKDLPKNGTYREIVLTGLEEEHKRSLKQMNLFEKQNRNFLAILPAVTRMLLGTSEETLKNPNVQKLLKADEKFDLVIVEEVMNDAHKAFAHHFNAPLIILSPIGSNIWITTCVGNSAPPSYVSEILLNYGSHMTFTERTINSLFNLIQQVFNHFYWYPRQFEIAKKYFPNPPKTIDDLLYNTSLVLLNSHTSISQPMPYVPNMIDIGGFHIKPPQKLPKELQQYLDNAKEGVIYFSLGSNIHSSQLPLEQRQAFLKTFSKLKLKVLWKWEDDVMPELLPNVKLAKWLPQQDILAHPNVKLFITHGGLLSTLETIYHGKPVLAIPFVGDQKLNSQRAGNQGIGLIVNFNELSEEILTTKINELLTNAKYATNAKTRSLLFHDREVGPLDTAIYWVEYVIRHRGAPHLRVTALDLRWYQYLLLDVIGFLMGVTIMILAVSYSFIKFLCCRRKTGQKKEKTH